MRTRLLLGGTGFLGAHLAASTAEEARVRGVVAARRPDRCAAFLSAERLERRAWDATRADASARLFDAVRPDEVLLAAALSRVRDCERDPALATRLNEELPAEVARLAAERGARLVHVSTDLVFGGAPPSGERYRELDPPSPLDVYGRSKAAGEARVLEADPTALVVRLPLLFGDSGGRGLGAGDQLIAALARGEDVVLFEDEFRTPLDVRVAARALLELVASDERGLLHVAGPERLSRWELGQRLARDRTPAGSPGRLRRGRRVDLGLDAVRPADASLDATRARARLTTPLPAP